MPNTNVMLLMSSGFKAFLERKVVIQIRMQPNWQQPQQPCWIFNNLFMEQCYRFSVLYAKCRKNDQLGLTHLPRLRTGYCTVLRARIWAKRDVSFYFKKFSSSLPVSPLIRFLKFSLTFKEARAGCDLKNRTLNFFFFFLHEKYSRYFICMGIVFILVRKKWGVTFEKLKRGYLKLWKCVKWEEVWSKLVRK